MEFYSGIIDFLEINEYFVFGSNTEGRHGKGSSLYALKHFGAEYGNPKGYQGQSYAIITKDLRKKIHPSIPAEYIIEQIETLYDHARADLNKKYYIAYNATTANLNAYSSREMVSFFNRKDIPENIIFEESFYYMMNDKLYQKNKEFYVFLYKEELGDLNIINLRALKESNNNILSITEQEFKTQYNFL